MTVLWECEEKHLKPVFTQGVSPGGDFERPIPHGRLKVTQDAILGNLYFRNELFAIRAADLVNLLLTRRPEIRLRFHPRLRRVAHLGVDDE